MISKLPPASAVAQRTAWRSATAPGLFSCSTGERELPTEVAVALTYNRCTHAIMMASPTDLEDFAYGFSLTEHIISVASDVTEFEVVAVEQGIELRMSLESERGSALQDRRRYLAGPSGCGLCGIDSLAEALRPPQPVASDLRLDVGTVAGVLRELAARQPLNHRTRAVHAAAFWEPANGIIAVREDVGRHNALDKVAGALLRAGRPATQGCVLLTSRVSVEMVQKTAAIGAPAIIAVSAPTALALEVARQAGITMIAVARDDGFEVFTHPARVRTGSLKEGSQRKHVS